MLFYRNFIYWIDKRRWKFSFLQSALDMSSAAWQPGAVLLCCWCIFYIQTNFIMPYYTSAGSIPHKRHTQFRDKNGHLYSEQLFSTEGFSNDYSLLYLHKCAFTFSLQPSIQFTVLICSLIRLEKFLLYKVSLKEISLNYLRERNITSIVLTQEAMKNKMLSKSLDFESLSQYT